MMKISVSNTLILTQVPSEIFRTITERLTFDNPKWIENDRMGRWNGETLRQLRYFTETDDGNLVTPRGFIRQLIGLCRRHNVQFDIDDKRRILPEMDFTFHGQLKPFQQEAVDEMLQKNFGTQSAPTGAGKTVMALYIIAERKQPALIICHTKELAFQWINRIETFLGIPAAEVGIIGNGKKTVGDRITVALVQSLYKCASDVSPRIGHLIVDECHRAPSRTFTEAVTAFDSKYMLGLSATPWRRDKLSKLIFWHIGDVIHEVDKADLVESGDILKAEVITRKTEFKPYFDPTTEYSRMLSELTEDTGRNNLIAHDVAAEAGNGGGICLVLSDRKSHCEALQVLLRNSFDTPATVLTGDIGNRDRQEIVDRLNRGEIKTLIATGQLIGEGFDCRQLSTLFLSTPIRFNGRVLQYLGRVLRPAPGKDRAKVFDYVDVNVRPLAASAKARERVYNG